MNLKTYIEKHCKTSVNKQLFASKYKISLTSLYAYAEGKREVPLSIAIDLVKDSNGEITLDDLANTYKEYQNGKEISKETSCEKTDN